MLTETLPLLPHRHSRASDRALFFCPANSPKISSAASGMALARAALSSMLSPDHRDALAVSDQVGPAGYLFDFCMALRRHRFAPVQHLAAADVAEQGLVRRDQGGLFAR